MKSAFSTDMRRRNIIFTILPLAFLTVFLSTFGFLTLVTEIVSGQMEPFVLSQVIVLAAEVTIAIAVSGGVFIAVSNFLLVDVMSTISC
jgi:hypothetical protein